METNKRLILKIGAIFIGVLLFLTFFSNTIYTFNLPSVVVEYPREGAITRTATGQGVVDFTVKDSYYAKISGKIELLATEGELVAEGSALYSITAADTLNEDIIRLKLEKAQADKAFSQTRLNNLRAGDADYDNEIQKARLAMEAAQKELADLQLLYEAGAIAQKDLDDKQAVVDNLSLQYQQQYERKQKALLELEKSVRDLQYQIEEYGLELQACAAGEITVAAERSGVVREIGGGVDSGAYIGQNELVMKIGVSSEDLQAVFALPENVDYLKVGDAVALSVKSRNIYNTGGEITRLIMEDGRLKAVVRFTAANVTGGETAEIKVQHTSDLYLKLVPLSAVRSGSFGEYVLYAEKVKSAFGYEYYAASVGIMVETKDNYNAAILLYTRSDNLPVIINSDKPISEGDRVRIVGGSDLVEIR